MFASLLGFHVDVAVDFLAAHALHLTLARRHYPLTNGCRSFARLPISSSGENFETSITTVALVVEVALALPTQLPELPQKWRFQKRVLKEQVCFWKGCLQIGFSEVARVAPPLSVVIKRPHGRQPIVVPLPYPHLNLFLERVSVEWRQVIASVLASVVSMGGSGGTQERQDKTL